MGMIGYYLRVNAEELASYQAQSHLLTDRIFSEDADSDVYITDVDKAWEGLFFLLSGQSMATADEAAAPFRWMMNQDQLIGTDENMEYGPAAYTTIQQTKEISDAINNISEEQSLNAFNADKMNEMEIYPEGAWAQEGTFDYLAEHFETLKDFYKKAADNDQAVIIFVS